MQQDSFGAVIFTKYILAFVASHNSSVSIKMISFSVEGKKSNWKHYSIINSILSRNIDWFGGKLKYWINAIIFLCQKCQQHFSWSTDNVFMTLDLCLLLKIECTNSDWQKLERENFFFFQKTPESMLLTGSCNIHKPLKWFWNAMKILTSVHKNISNEATAVCF